MRSVRRAPLSTSATVDVDALVVLREGDDLAPLDHLGTDRTGTASQDGLEAALGDEQPPAGAQRVVDSDVEPGDDVGELPPREGVHADDGALGKELRLGLRLDLVLDARSPEQLDGPQMEVRGPGQRRSSAQALDDDRRHAVLREEHGGRETDQPSA